MNNQKGIAPIAIILIIIGVLAVGGGIFYYKEQKKTESLKNELDNLAQQEKQKEQKGDLSNYSAGDIEDPNFHGVGIDETADLKTYRNEKYGFEFKYPYYFTNIENEQLNKHPNYGGSYYFSVMISQPESSVWKYWRYFSVEVTDGIPSESIFKLKSSNVTVSNEFLKIYWFEGGEDTAGSSFGQIPIYKNNRWFLLNIKRESVGELEDDFRKILSTFKFIK